MGLNVAAQFINNVEPTIGVLKTPSHAGFFYITIAIDKNLGILFTQYII
jgi:hypothetical protein